MLRPGRRGRRRSLPRIACSTRDESPSRVTDLIELTSLSLECVTGHGREAKIPGMAERSIDLHAPGVAEMLAAPATLSVWEVGRRLARPVTAAEIAEALDLDIATAQRSLDWLEEHRLVERLPMRANRRVPTYRASAEELVLIFDPAKVGAAAQVDRVVAASRDHVLRQLAQCMAIADGIDSWAVNSHCSVQLEQGDLEEFRRLMAEVTGFLDAAQARVRKVDPAEARSVNVHLSLDACSAAGPALPAPRCRCPRCGSCPPAVRRQAMTPPRRAASPRSRRASGRWP